MVAVGSCLVVAGGHSQTAEILDTHRNRVWNLPPFVKGLASCSMVALASQIAAIGGRLNRTCATLPQMDRKRWCFCRLCEQQPNGWYHKWEGMLKLLTSRAVKATLYRLIELRILH